MGSRSKTGDQKVAAYTLRMAYANGPVGPLRSVLAPDDIEGAYAVQDINTARWVESGRRPVGYKIGLTDASLQARLGITEPDFGILFEDMRVENGGTLTRNFVLQPRVEGEIALIIGQDILVPPTSGADVRASVALARPAIEIVGSRIANWAVTAADTIADNASAGAFVLGDALGTVAQPELPHARMTMRIDGEVVGEGLGAPALGDPLESLAWLARAAINRGQPLLAGDLVLTGALAPMVPLAPGAHVEVVLEEIGSVSFTLGK